MFRRLFFQQHRSILILAAILLFPALLTNLGMLAFYDDEGIRSLVALEMKYSGNYFNPTLLGELYYNKPPLYNWILLLVFEITGSRSEFTARAVTVFFLLVYAVIVFHFLRKAFKGHEPENSNSESGSDYKILALVAAFALITCGRILFWDSLLALIDISFSLLIYLLFMLVFFQGEKGQYNKLFAGAYFLAAIAFLLKGLPAVVFLGITLLTYFIWRGKRQLLLSWAHVAGVVVFMLIVGAYYAVYAKQHELETVLSTLFHESTKRTFIQYGLGKSLIHAMTFPFEMAYHFLPWTILLVYFIKKRNWNLINSNPFIKWNLLVFFTTIIPYWTSVEVYPRYILMHVPLLFTAILYLHYQDKAVKGSLSKVLESLFFIVCAVSIVAVLIPFFRESMQQVPFFELKSAGLALLLLILCSIYWRYKSGRLLVFSVVLLILRLGFNWFVLPERLQVECSTKVRTSTIHLVKKYVAQDIHILEYSLGFQPITGYYYTRETGKILNAHYRNFDLSALYIINPDTYPAWTYEALDRLQVKWNCRELVIGKINRSMLDWMQNRK